MKRIVSHNELNMSYFKRVFIHTTIWMSWAKQYITQLSILWPAERWWSKAVASAQYNGLAPNERQSMIYNSYIRRVLMEMGAYFVWI